MGYSYGQCMSEKSVGEIAKEKNFQQNWIRDFADEWIDAVGTLKESNIDRSEYERRRNKDAKKKKRHPCINR